MNNREIEAKFYVLDLKRIETRLQSLGARLIQPRILETNIRFDLPNNRFHSEGRVLRLRQDTAARLTYKDSGNNEQGVLNRTEIEFTVESFEKAKLFLEALGYQKLLEYEKYRTTYVLESGSLLSAVHEQAHGLQSYHIMLDELPYGNFVEIEGEDIQAIQDIAEKLKLDRDAAIPYGYSALFEIVRETLKLPFTDLTFANFEGITVSPEHLQVRPADESAGQKHD
ncbi:MAG TPA: class IV adenylate cyclase [Anaerolineales bacterium]|nr:class IV adenylate cyclase [Anaerolineales bacterium]